jgi:hypothetical protein
MLEQKLPEVVTRIEKELLAAKATRDKKPEP